MAAPSRTTRFYFESLETAALGLLTVLEDARVTTATYSFGSLSADQVLASGLILVGDIEEVVSKLDSISGALRYDE